MDRLNELWPELWKAALETLYMTTFALVLGGILGLAIGVAASFAIGRIVEQHLVSVSPGVIEAARSMGAGPWRILFTVAIPESLGPLILGYTFIVVALIDMTAMAGLIGGGGLGAFAQIYGFRQFEPVVMWVAIVLIVVFVHLVQMLGTRLARKVIRR